MACDNVHLQMANEIIQSHCRRVIGIVVSVFSQMLNDDVD